MIYKLLAHAGHDEAAEATNSLTGAIAHLPLWQAMTLAIVVLLAGYAVLSMFKLKLFSRVLGLLPLVIAMAVFYMEHQPQVTAMLLSGGFIVVFVLAFAMLKAPSHS